MFKKILIANRGEIACRIIKTCARMRIRTVAVFSDVDRNSLHVQMADESVFIGDSEAKDSYLSIEKIIDACATSGADAVHPGYGFLSENSNFCKALNKIGITFIGPPANSIESMGDKIASKLIAVEAGVSTVPGFLGIVKDKKEASKIANDIGYPVMIKASAGGGGKGMRIARDADEVLEGFVSSQNEAKKSFGDSRIFIEKYIDKPRHIEIQILGDMHGNYIFFGERECSIQRRNQKIIEEAPSPILTPSIRKTMGKQAIALARSVGYFSAGTVEFIVDSKQNFYFLEMNTRLQVEHPVTELVYRVDLVEEMIRVAAKKKITFSQRNIEINGWAIESRIYAEDPAKNFLPSTGRLNLYSPPKEVVEDAFKIRNDSGVYEGAEISIYYDPMIAKLCVWAADRKMAINKMQEALDSFNIEGVQTNLNFLSAVMKNAEFEKGNFSTAFISDQFPRGFNYTAPDRSLSHYFAMLAACMQELINTRLRRSFLKDFKNNPANLKFISIVDDTEIETSFRRVNEETFIFDLDLKNELEVIIDWAPGNQFLSATIGSLKLKIKVKSMQGSFIFYYRGVRAKIQVRTPREAELSKFMIKRQPVDVSQLVICPMPGLLVNLEVSVGDEVVIGQALCTIEAMKMENILRSEKNSIVRRINKKVGDSLGVDDLIMEFD